MGLFGNSSNTSNSDPRVRDALRGARYGRGAGDASNLGKNPSVKPSKKGVKDAAKKTAESAKSKIGQAVSKVTNMPIRQGIGNLMKWGARASLPATAIAYSPEIGAGINKAASGFDKMLGGTGLSIGDRISSGVNSMRDKIEAATGTGFDPNAPISNQAMAEAKTNRLRAAEEGKRTAANEARADALDTDAFQTAFNAEQNIKQGGVVPFASRGISTADPNMAAKDDTGAAMGITGGGKEIYLREGMGNPNGKRFNQYYETEADARAASQARVGDMQAGIRAFQDLRGAQANAEGRRTGLFGNQEFDTGRQDRFAAKQSKLADEAMDRQIKLGTLRERQYSNDMKAQENAQDQANYVRNEKMGLQENFAKAISENGADSPEAEQMSQAVFADFNPANPDPNDLNFLGNRVKAAFMNNTGGILDKMFNDVSKDEIANMAPEEIFSRIKTEGPDVPGFGNSEAFLIDPNDPSKDGVDIDKGDLTTAEWNALVSYLGTQKQ